VERLVVDNEVITLRYPGTASRRVVWLGHRDVDCSSHPEPERVWPVRVAAGAFGDGLPWRELFLSPEHAVYCEGILRLASESDLENGNRVDFVEGHAVTLFPGFGGSEGSPDACAPIRRQGAEVAVVRNLLDGQPDVGSAPRSRQPVTIRSS
jgi:hypothetical protein